MISDTKHTASVYIFGGVQMSEKEFNIISAFVARGNCPYCYRSGLKNNYGSKRKHIHTCGKRFTLLGKEKLFAEIIRDDRRSVSWSRCRFIGQ